MSLRDKSKMVEVLTTAAAAAAAAMVVAVEATLGGQVHPNSGKGTRANSQNTREHQENIKRNESVLRQLGLLGDHIAENRLATGLLWPCGVTLRCTKPSLRERGEKRRDGGEEGERGEGEYGVGKAVGSGWGGCSEGWWVVEGAASILCMCVCSYVVHCSSIK